MKIINGFNTARHSKLTGVLLVPFDLIQVLQHSLVFHDLPLPGQVLSCAAFDLGSHYPGLVHIKHVWHGGKTLH